VARDLNRIVTGIAFWSTASLAMLATCAVTLPHGCTKEKAYVTAMKSDLRNMAMLQEAFHAEHHRFATTSDIQTLSRSLYQSTGVNLVLEADANGWRARTTHVNLRMTSCAMRAGDDMPICQGRDSSSSRFTKNTAANIAVDLWLFTFTLSRRHRRLAPHPG
jgi:hypothetical protein